MKQIYLAHPFGGKVENIEKSKQIQEVLTKQNPTIAIVNPLANMGHLFGKITEEQAKKINDEILLGCDELWLCEGWEKSKGCLEESRLANTYNIPIKFIYKGEKLYASI